MSCRVSTTKLIAGACVVGNRGLGVTGAVVRANTATGAHGAGYLYNDWQAGDDAKEFRGLIVTPPSAGVFFAREDGSFDLTGAPDGAYSFVYRLFVDGADLGTATATVNIGSVAVPAPVNSTAPTVTGSAVQGQSLTASNGTWANTPTGYAYRWLRGATAIAGATANTYVLQAADVGSQMRVGVIATNATGSSTEALSLQTVVIGAAADTTVPTLGGVITVGAVTPSSIQISWPAGADNVAVTSYETSLDGTVWTDRGNVLSYTCVGLIAATSYTLRVRAKDIAGNVSTPALSVTQVTSSGAVIPVNTVAPVITGSAVQGQLLSGTVGSWSNTPASYTYRWIRNGVTIVGATSSTYLLTANEIGYQVQLGVTASNVAGSSTETISAATATVVVPVVDSVAPSLLGTIDISFLNASGYTATCPVATDASGVNGYQYRINAGTWTDIASGRAVTITGRSSGVTDTLEMRAHDAALNYSSALSRAVTPISLSAFVFPGGEAAINMLVPKKAIAMLGNFVKQTDEAIDYDINFTDWFVGRIDSIGSIDVLAETGILVLGSAFSGNIVRVVLGGGVNDNYYKITVRITTTAALPIVREVDFFVAVANV